MNQDEVKVFFSIIRSAIDGNRLNDDELKAYSFDMLPNMLKLSAKHDVIHLLAFGLKQNELIGDGDGDIEKYILRAVYRCENLRYEYEKLCDILEKTKVFFLPLKGSVIRKLYPEEWMRTSCDIDILVHENDSEKVKSVLIEKYGYKYHEKGSHDISLFSPTGIHIELHYNLVEGGRANESSKVLKDIWGKVSVRQGFEYCLEMPDEMYYFYHIAHMAKHFEDGGCGIRPFIDLWVLDNMEESNQKKRNQLLDQGRLLKFAQVSRKLSRTWFETGMYDLVSKQMEDYILRGGVYGNNENRIMVHQQRSGGRIKYAISKLFIPYDVIKFHYPILQQHRWLTPFMQIRRWCKLIFCGHLRRTTKELRYNNNISSAEAANMQTFLNNIGL